MDYDGSSSRNSRQLSQPIHSAFPDFGGKKDFGILYDPVFRFKSSRYCGVQKIKDKETYVAHVYDNGHSPKTGRTIYLGRFDKEENAARAHDLVTLKFWGTSAQTNFPVSDYEKALEDMQNLTDQDVVVAVRRSSSSFSRGKSKYRGVVRRSLCNRHTNSGKWQARKGPGKDSFLGTFESEEEAAIAFDIASIKLKGSMAITNFDINSYNVKAILQAETQQMDSKAEKMVNLSENFAASNIQEKPEGSGIRNKRTRRSPVFQNCPGKQAETDFSGQTNALSETPVAASAGSESQDGHIIPFLSNIASTEHPAEPVHGSLAIQGFRHSNSSAFQSYKHSEHLEPPILQEADTRSLDFEPWSANIFPPYMSELSKEQELKVIGSVFGFQHASSSGFKPFRNRDGK